MLRLPLAICWSQKLACWASEGCFILGAAGICICMLLLLLVPVVAVCAVEFAGSCPGWEFGLSGVAESPSMPLSRDGFGILCKLSRCCSAPAGGT
jgi:hypothetical protein